MKFRHKAAATLLLLALLAGSAGGLYAWRWQQAPVDVDAPRVVTLEPGESFSRFAARLHRQGLIEHPRLWAAMARLTDRARQIQAGEYRVQPGDSPNDLLSRLVEGRVVHYQVKIVEGWTAMQAVARLASHPELEREIDGVSPETLLDVLGLPGGHAEGLFFPDTYHFVRGDSDADVLRRAYRRMSKVLAQAWENRADDLPYETPYEALIAASLIEKETGRDRDRPRIAQVFALRLELGMRLQTDPSVIYGIGREFDGDLRRVHLREDTPYNTYVHRGLPPTPIALPGGDSIRAALNPAEGEYLFFVSRGDGTSEFSASLDEHRRAVRRYQLE
ncbi:MAG: endolytic transglycosylase MltG [Pseudomonadota bacterium]